MSFGAQAAQWILMPVPVIVNEVHWPQTMLSLCYCSNLIPVETEVHINLLQFHCRSPCCRCGLLYIGKTIHSTYTCARFAEACSIAQILTVLTPHSHSDFYVRGLFDCQSETTWKLEEQHLIFHIGSLQANGMNIKFSNIFNKQPSLFSTPPFMCPTWTLTHFPPSTYWIFLSLTS